MKRFKLCTYNKYFLEKLSIKSSYNDERYFLIAFGLNSELKELKLLEKEELNELKNKYKILNKKRGN